MNVREGKTIVALYDNFAEAQRVVQDLVDHGFPRSEVSIVASDAEGRYAEYLDTEEQHDEVGGAEGAGFGAVVGGLTGLLVSLGALAIPGIGPVLVAGPIAATLIGAGVGAVTGGIIGALVDLGVPEEEAGYYAEGVRRGGTLVTVKSTEEMTERAEEIMEAHNPIDLEERTGEWHRSGWTGFDPDAEPHRPVVPERERDWVGSTTSETAYTAPSSERRVTDYAEFDTYEDNFRNHYNSYYTNTNYTYDQYTPAYRYGYILATDTRYRDRDWAEIEPEAHRHWETNEEGTWENFKDAVRHGWHEVKEAVGAESHRRRDFNAYDDTFRRHYNTHYVNTNYTYDQYTPAYRYGYTLATDDRYRGRNWAEIEPEARRYWETHHRESTWEEFKDAVRHGWHEIKEAVGAESHHNRRTS